MDDFAVVGSGIGGACSAHFPSSKFQTTLYEKEPSLGGCSSTFKHQKSFYNTGATTFAGYEKDTYMYDFFERHHIDFQKKLLPSALCVLMDGKKIVRFQDMNAFLKYQSQLNEQFINTVDTSSFENLCDSHIQFFKNYILIISS